MEKSEKEHEEAELEAGAESSDPGAEGSNSPQELQRQIDLLTSNLAIKESMIESMRKKNSHFETKISEFRDFVKKMEDEVQSVRSRAERDLSKQVEQAKINFFSDFLPIVDNLDRGMKAIDESDPSYEGFQLIRKQIDDLLSKNGISKIETEGKVFNPEIHEAITTVPVPNEEQDELVIEEVNPGYCLNDRVVRTAHVIVGKFA